MFNLAALGAGLGEFAQQYRQQQEQALRQQQLQMQMQQFAQRQQEQQRQASAQAGLNTWMRSGAADQFHGLSPMPQAGGSGGSPDMGGGMRAGGALTGGGKGALGFPELRSYAQQAGFQGSKADEMAAISLAESGGNPFAHNPKYPDDSYGLTQINALAHGPKAKEALGNPLRAMQLAYEVSGGGQNFKPWTTYTKGTYRRFLGQGGGADAAAGTGDFSVPSHGAPPAAAPDTVETAQQQGPAATPASFQQPMPEAQYRQQQPGGFGAQGAFGDSGPGAPQQAQQQADPMAAVQQQVEQGIQKTAQTIPPPLFGRVGLQALMKQIDQANPGADEATKFMMLEGAQQLLAPDAKMQYEYWKQQNDQTLKKEMATFQHNLSLDKAGSWVVQTEPETGEQYRYNATTAQATTLDGKPYKPKGAQKLGGAGGGGSPLSADRAKDLATETARLDKEWLAENPLADQGQKQQAHFQNRTKAEHALAEAKTSTGRQSPQTMIFRKDLEEHPEWNSAEMQTAFGNQLTNAAIARSVGNGDIGKQIRAVNTVADHILRVEDYAEALRNGQLPRANQLVNTVATELGRPEVTTFEAGRDIMADEVVRLLTSTGGTEADRKGMQSRISAAQSPEQLAGALNAFKDFTGARFEAIRQQVARGDPKKEAQFENELLTEPARRVFKGMKPPGKASAGAAKPAAAGQPEASGAEEPLPDWAKPYPDGQGFDVDGVVKIKRGDKFIVTPGAVKTP